MLNAIRMWLLALFRRDRVEAEMDKEMRLHLDMETEENIRRGMSPDAARRAALVAFGGVDAHQESVRDARLTRRIEHVLADLRFALRSARKSPGFTVSVAALLALGIGANAALFGVVYNLLISPLPHPDGNRMVQMYVTGGGGEFYVPLKRSLAESWAANTRAAEQVALIAHMSVVIGDTAGSSPLEGIAITPGTLALAGARPLFGRDVAASDTAAGAPPVVLLGHRVWERTFAGRRDVLGSTVLLNGQPHMIIGVMPPGFTVPFFELSDAVFPALGSSAESKSYFGIAKLREGVENADADRELAALWRRDAALGSMEDIPVVKRAAELVRPGVRNMVYLLLVAVIVVWLIASANVANLLMARAWSRTREMSVRAALGAGRLRLVQQMFIESAVLALFGGVLGVAVAWASLKIIAALKPDAVDLALQRAGMQSTVLWATAALALASGIFYGIGPALLASSGRLIDGLKAGARTATGSVFARKVRASLVVGEVALSVVLLGGAGLLIRSLMEMQKADIGMDTRGLHAVFVRMRPAQFPTPEARRAAWVNAVEAVHAVPGVEGVTFAMMMPPHFAAGLRGFEIEGRVIDIPDSLRTVGFNYVSPDYFKFSGIRLTRGRTFLPNESTGPAEAGPEMIINEMFARRYWPNEDPIGKRVKFSQNAWAEVVGVVDDVRVPGAARRDRSLQLYQPISAAPLRASIIVRSSLPPAALGEAMTTAVRTANPLMNVGPLEIAAEELRRVQQPHRFLLKLLGIFAALALLLAGVGLHAAIAYAVGQRIREFGVRLALGAEPTRLLRAVHAQGIGLVVVGLVLGVVGILAATRLMRALLYGVGPGDPVTIAGVALLLVLTAIVATHFPARRAMRVDPVTVLREE